MRNLLLPVLIFLTLATGAQTLYWVGGSGNFNDPMHWSLSSGGPTANQVPSGNKDAIFDNNSGFGNLVVTMVGINHVRSLTFHNDFLPITVNGNKPSELNISGNFLLNQKTSFLTSSKLIFNSSAVAYNDVRFGATAYTGDVVFNAGNWNIRSININSENSLTLKSGNFKLLGGNIRTGDLIANTGKVNFEVKNGIFSIEDEITLGMNVGFNTNGLYMRARTSDPSKYHVAPNFNYGSGAKLMDPAMAMACGATLTSVGISCSGVCDGKLIFTIDPTCGPAPFNLIWSNPSCTTAGFPSTVAVAGTYTINGLCSCADFYGLVVLDNAFNLLTISNTQNIPGQSAITFFPFGYVQPTCNGLCNGSFIGNLSGSVPPYTVTLSGANTSVVAVNSGNTTYTNMCAGITSVSVVDAIGCTRSFTVNLNQPTIVSPNLTTFSTTCNGVCNGSAVVTPTGGAAGGYTVTFSPGGTFTVPVGGSATVTNLCAGTVVNVTVTNVNSCTASASGTITQPPALTVTPTQTNVACSGSCTGVASVAVTGGVAPYTFTWSPGPGNTNNINSLCAGTQTVTIGHNSGLCTNTQTFNILGPPNFTITPTVTNVACNSGSNGAISLSVTGGNGAPYSFTWSPAPGGGQGTSTASSLTAGSYTATITDGSGCFTTAVVSVTAPPAYTVNVTTQTIICFGACTGSAVVGISGSNGAPYTINWSPAPGAGQGTGTITNLCVGSYTATITDALGCPTTAVVNITQPSSVTPNITSTSVTCNGLCNGVINAAPVGGNAPYTYTLITPLGASVTSSPPFNGLCTGVYTLVIRDVNLCPSTFTVNIDQPNPLVPSVGITSVTCFNSCNGSLAGNVVGGTPTYTLIWTTPGGTVAGGAINGQCAGTYTLNITDANGCTANTVVTLNQPTQITATINPNNPTCFGSCNGVLNANVAGGTPGYTLNWSNGFTGNPNSGLCAGIYTLTVTDANACTAPFTATLTAPPQITLTVNTASPSCAGSCDGSATVTATGGTPPFTFQFNTVPVTTNTTGIVTGLCVGNYIATATDGNGCSLPINFSINNPPALAVNVTSIQTSCNACTGAATISPSGGTPTYAVVWTNTLGATVGTNVTVGGLCPGNYTATVTDAGGCSSTATLNIAMTVSVSVLLAGSGIQCFNACTGSAVATATGGTLPYTYTWNPSGQNSATATALCAGNYTVTVADLLGCTNTGTISLANPPDITVTVTQTNVSCFGNCNGILSATATGGTGAITYSWSPGPILTPSIGSLCAGVYTLVVTDANNCTKTPPAFTITQNPALTATFSPTNPSGCALNNGSICATVSGGNGGPYTYTWTPGVSNASCATGLGAGNYSVIISDGVCTTTLATSLTNPSGPTVTVNSTSVACFGGATGSATVAAAGTGPFTFTWSPGTASVVTGNTVTASGMLSGTYNISVTDGNGCITTLTTNIAQPSSLTVNSTLSNPLCNAGPCTGSIVLNTSGATPGYTFNWTPGVITGQGTQTVTNLCAGNYTVNITDANGCAQTRTFNLTAPPALSIAVTSTNVLCFNSCNGTAIANASGGTAPLSYSWAAVGFTGAITPTVINLCPNVYTVIATDGNNCTISQTVGITQPTQLTSTLSATSLSVTCSNSCNATVTHSVAGGTPGYTFTWSGSPLTTSVVTNFCPGNYTATITDANSCTVAASFTVTAPPPFNVTVTPTSPLCNAVCNGSISTTLSGAQGTVNFVWTPAGVGQNPTGLCAGNYTLIATDNNSCQVNAVATLTNPLAVLANVTSTNPACNGNCNGVAISNATNVVAPVSYTWLPGGPNSPTNTALCAGNYTVIVQDANGCQDVQTFTLNNPAPLNVNPAVAPATCGANNGSITIVAVGGTPAYSYTWAPIVSNASVVTGLGANIYTVVVSDANNCTNTVSIPLSNANGPSVTPVASTSILCNGAASGGATVNIGGISGGTPTYTAVWLVPPAPSSVNPLSNIPAGTYTAQITDANSCIVFTAVTIAQPAPITILANVGLPTCNGICNGSVSLNTNGGVAPYTYSWNPLGPNNSATLTNACAGNYTVIITDGNGCPSTQTLNLPAALNMVATTSITSNPCSNSCIATASVTSVSGGLPPLTYAWSNGQTGTTANGLCAGIYTVVVTDANSCFNSFTTQISSPPAITATNSVASPSCNMCNGSSSITASGGTGVLTYSWTTGTTGTVATNLCAGLYQVLITDNNGCQQTQNVVISSSSGITGETFSVQNIACAGNCNGGATVTPIGGNAPITFSWIAPTSTISSISNVCAGVYFVQMTDAQGCVRTASTNVNAAPGMTLAPFITQPDCGSNNGIINVVTNGGTPGYTYAWVPAAGNTPSIVNVGPGTYSITVTDANGCSKNDIFTISNENAPVISFTQTNINCFNACTGSITASASGTSTPFTFTWSVGGSSTTVTNLCKGVIVLTVTAANGCKSLQTFTVTDNPQMQLSLPNVVQPLCNNDCNGSIALVPSGGVLPYTFSWSPTGNSNPQFSLCAGNYSAVVTDAKGCIVSTSVTLNNPALLTATNNILNSSCSSIADGGATVTPAGGTPTYSYSWSGPNSFTAATQSLSNIFSGSYTVVVTDSKGCNTTNTIDVVSTITIVANAGRDTTFCTNNSVVLNGTNTIGAVNLAWIQAPNPTPTLATTNTLQVTPAIGSTTFVLIAVSSVQACFDVDTVVVNSLALPDVDAGDSYTIPMFSTVQIGGVPTSSSAVTFTWLPPFTLDNGSVPNPIANNTVNTNYTVIVTDANGCVSSDTMRVHIYPEIKIPNGFSPNGDSRNDMWVIDNLQQFTENEVEIYNRWGELLYYKKNYQSDYDGKYKGKDLPVGTYYYIIKLNHPAYPNPYTGPLTIFR